MLQSGVAPYTMVVRRVAASLILTVWLWGSTAVAQDTAKAERTERDASSESKPSDGGGVGAFPILAYTPETSGMFGGFVVYHFDSPHASTRTGPAEDAPKRSSIKMAAFYTLKKQYVVALAPTVYLGHDWRLSGEVALSYFPDTFYPVGPNSDEDASEEFTQRTFWATAGVERRLVSHLSTGVRVFGASNEILRVEPGGRLDSGNVLGSTGGQIYAAGPSLVWDSRERDFSARYGARHAIEWLVYPPLFNADYGFSEVRVDLRQYLGTVAGQVLALQLYCHTTWHRVPFQSLAPIGGDGRMRGYYATRYLDRASLSGQAEYRMPLFWRLGAVAFVGAGSVAPSLLDFETQYLRYVGGVGLRGALNEKDGVNLRLDLGMTGEKTRAFYFQIGEAF